VVFEISGDIGFDIYSENLSMKIYTTIVNTTRYLVERNRGDNPK